MPEDDCLIPGLDAVAFTAYFGELSGMPRQEAMKRAHDVLYYVGLGEARYRLLETYSAGMKQRLKLAQALVHDPKLLFLDEPTSNLDPQGRTEILELIADITSKKDINVLISSHILTDIEQTCSLVVILNKGKVAAQGEIAALRGARFSLYEIKIKGEAGGFLGRSPRPRAAGSRRPRTGSLKVYLPAAIDRRRRLPAAAAERRPDPAFRQEPDLARGPLRPDGGSGLMAIAERGYTHWTGEPRRPAAALAGDRPARHPAGLQAQILQVRLLVLASSRPSSSLAGIYISERIEDFQ